MPRVFKYNDQVFQDPGEEWSVEDIKKSLAQTFPEIAQATVNEKTLDDGTVEVTFVKRSGTKGMQDPPLKTTGRKHNHAEAFCLMRYTCERCQHSEIYWNSRDGVTPFMCRCPACEEGNMVHSNWRQDQYAPDHIPTPGQGVWIDMPESLRRPVAAGRVKSFDGSEYELQGDERTDMIKHLTDAMFHPGEPWLIHWPGRNEEP